MIYKTYYLSSLGRMLLAGYLFQWAKAGFPAEASFDRNRFSERSVGYFTGDPLWSDSYLRRDCPQNS